MIGINVNWIFEKSLKYGLSTVFKANDNLDDLLDEIDENLKQKNIQNVKRQLSEEKLIEDLEKIFNS